VAECKSAMIFVDVLYFPVYYYNILLCIDIRNSLFTSDVLHNVFILFYGKTYVIVYLLMWILSYSNIHYLLLL